MLLSLASEKGPTSGKKYILTNVSFLPLQTFLKPVAISIHFGDVAQHEEIVLGIPLLTE